MPETPALARTYVQTSCTARDPRVAVAVESVAIDAFPPLQPSWRELPIDALVRMLEDLQVHGDARVLCVEPFSVNLPALLARLSREVVVVCSHVERAEQLRAQLLDCGANNASVTTFVQDYDGAARFDRIVVMQPANEELGPVLQGQLAVHGRAVWSVDRACPPRRVRRLLQLDEASTLEEDLDLVSYMPLLGDMLVEAGVVLRQEVAEAVVAAQENHRRLGEELLARGAVREQDLYRVLADQRGVSFRTAADVLPRVDPEMVGRLPRKYLSYYRFLPVRRDGDEVLVATCDVDLPVHELGAVFDAATVRAELVTPTDLERVWAAIDLGLVGVTRGLAAVGVAAPPSDAVVTDSQASVLLDAILADALQAAASDVHLDARADGVRLRFRVHGCLHDVDRHQVRKEDLAGMIGVMSRVARGDEQAASRSLRWSCGGRDVGVVMSRQETVHGASVSLRLMGCGAAPKALDELGFDDEVVAAWRRELRPSQGLVLVCGPERSGRGATIYAGLRQLVLDPSRKVVTIESAPAFSLAGIQQTVASPAGVAAAVDVAAMQAADVLVVGQLADDAAAQAAVRAARKGHLVLAAMHAEDGVDALQQLLEHGVSRSAIASAVTAVFVQRLARRTCAECRQPVELSAEQRARLFPDGAPEGFVAQQGKGCDRCRGTGFDGMVPLVEYLPNAGAVRRALRRGVAPHDLGPVVTGGRRMRDSALALLRQGLVSPGELRRVLAEDHLDLREDFGAPVGRCS